MWIPLLFCAASAAPLDALEAWARAHPPPDAPPPEIDGYSFVGAHLAGLIGAARRRPGVVEVESIGETTWGHPIWALHVAEPGPPPDDRVLILAGIHALEWIGVEVAVRLLHDLIERPARGTRVTVIPVLNVDGRLKTEADLALGDLERYRRGNGAVPPIDLNRDFGIWRDATSAWRHVLPGYHAPSPTGALSQPESGALDALAARQGYDRAVSLHAFGGYHYYPWAGRWRRTADWGAFVALGRGMEAAQGSHAYRPRQLSRWGFFFRAQGAEIDHLYGRYGTLAFLIELTRSGLRPPKILRDRRTPFRWYNPVRPERHIERAPTRSDP